MITKEEVEHQIKEISQRSGSYDKLLSIKEALTFSEREDFKRLSLLHFLKEYYDKQA